MPNRLHAKGKNMINFGRQVADESMHFIQRCGERGMDRRTARFILRYGLWRIGQDGRQLGTCPRSILPTALQNDIRATRADGWVLVANRNRRVLVTCYRSDAAMMKTGILGVLADAWPEQLGIETTDGKSTSHKEGAL